VVAGIAAAQALAGLPLDRERTLSLATAIEGHPDNVAPAVMGGLVSSYVEDATTVTTRWVGCRQPAIRLHGSTLPRPHPRRPPGASRHGSNKHRLLAGGPLPRHGERHGQG
jgi:hypothetical protein